MKRALKFTPQQKQALRLLPADGSWYSGNGNGILNCLLLFPIELVKAERVNNVIRWKLTPEGINARNAK
jgi:hypothetical protein